MRTKFVIGSILTFLLVSLWSSIWSPAGWLFLPLIPLIALGVYDMVQSGHSLRRNFPLFSRGRWILEGLRPFVRQYLFESETDGAPVPRMFRSVVYQRAKGQSDTVPFGTKYNTYRNGYEWIAHSMGAIDIHGTLKDPRVVIGGPDCTQPYSASLLNISAMSFGALSSNAIKALNGGASLGNFAHNTGEGGLSRHHLEGGGDIIWQIGTGYFGCRSEEGGFDADKFAATAANKQVRMIEIKVSQGAKPGHGGILPAIKNTQEIADARGVPVGTMVVSPPGHSAFSTPIEFMQFIGRLRTLCDGKPIGFKLCVGRESEVVALCKAMIETGIKPDFITVDGGEGGTGAAPLEFSNSVGMPLRDGLAFVCDCLSGFDLKKDIRVIAVGKIFTAFHVVKNLSIGADICYSARGFMMSLGCVQSLVCNTNHCPTGVATQDPNLAKGLVVSDKRARVQNYHAETIEHINEIVAAAGLSTPCELNRTHVYRRINQREVCRYDQIFQYTNVGSLLSEPYPERFEQQMAESDASSFLPRSYVAQHAAGISVLDEAASA